PGRHRRYNRIDFARLELMRQLTIQGVTAAEAARVARDLRGPGEPAQVVPDDDQARPAGPGPALSLRRAALALDPAALDRLPRPPGCTAGCHRPDRSDRRRAVGARREYGRPGPASRRGHGAPPCLPDRGLRTRLGRREAAGRRPLPWHPAGGGCRAGATALIA